MAGPRCVSVRGQNLRFRPRAKGNMVKYFCTGAALAAVLVIPVAAPAVDLSLTSIYQGRPVVAATGWALADRWTIASTIDTAAPRAGLQHRQQSPCLVRRSGIHPADALEPQRRV